VFGFSLGFQILWFGSLGLGTATSRTTGGRTSSSASGWPSNAADSGVWLEFRLSELSVLDSGFWIVGVGVSRRNLGKP
jgi:hypothetical protein